MTRKFRLAKPKEFLYQIGNAHDVRIDSIEWIPQRRALTVSCVNLFSGLVDPPHALTAKLVFEEVQAWEANIQPVNDYLAIGNLDLAPVGQFDKFVFDLWLQGQIVVVAKTIVLECDREPEDVGDGASLRSFLTEL